MLAELVRGGDEYDPALDRSIDVHIARLRAVLEDDPKHPRRILDRARRRLRVRKGAKLMRRFYLRIYLALFASLAVFAVLAGMTAGLLRLFDDLPPDPGRRRPPT